jgi:hypothetical protein
MQLIHWLAEQPPSVATFLGTLTGSLFGLLAILAGALFNAHLNRNRDDRLRNEEARALRTALVGELTGIRDAFKVMSQRAVNNEPAIAGDGILVPDFAAGERVMPLLLPRFGLLSSDQVRQVIDAYVTIDQFHDKLMLLAHGELRPPERRGGFVQVPAAIAAHVGSLARGTAEKIDAAISRLSASN